jgi:hypothetical protein
VARFCRNCSAKKLGASKWSKKEKEGEREMTEAILETLRAVLRETSTETAESIFENAWQEYWSDLCRDHPEFVEYDEEYSKQNFKWWYMSGFSVGTILAPE